MNILCSMKILYHNMSNKSAIDTRIKICYIPRLSGSSFNTSQGENIASPRRDSDPKNLKIATKGVLSGYVKSDSGENRDS
jgi:hypothetical protein